MTQLSTRTTQTIAVEINSIKDQTRKIALYNSIEIGRRLFEAKTMVPHGEWGAWLKESVDYSPTTANNLLKIFEQYGSNQLSLFGDNAKSQAIGNLTYTQAVALLGISEDDRERFVADNDVENMSTRDLQQAIKEKQQLERQLKESEAKAEKERAARKKIDDSYAELEKVSNAHNDLAKRLEAELEEAKALGDKEAVEKLQVTLLGSETNLAESRERVKELEEELKKKPIDVPVKEIVEKIPDNIQKELEDLRKKVASGTGEETAVFKAHFKTLTDTFSNLLSALEVIRSADPELHEKYKGAVAGLLGKMSDRV
ncbi:DUF3102 domain-containing protein [Paenibacillus crassostreae]|uniref:Preprotein translocase subunit SecA n=1 Tax=Paenibacillus crassostreae TaxID=1763538 RepID=A0A167C6I3_9BACL|nr:DUF3102 domain-containing protein [Paenibacillus crassostreae]AOZ91586.1 hypothetical protein LPB68_04725 [Paenibacillus crassostreae]OAB72840.1 hypothetical protein PNBC_15525 [Paenibacillus crassostreae]